MMQIRNARRLPDGRIDLEVEHETLGWIPFTADPDDVEELGREAHAAALAAETDGSVVIPDAEVFDPGPPELSPRQFEWLLAYSGLEDVWGAVRDGAKGQGNMKLYADLRAQERAGGYYLDQTLAFIATPTVQSVIAQVAPDADLSEARITALWDEAAAQTFDTIG